MWAGSVIACLQDVMVTNFHWVWLVSLFGSFFVYGPLSWQYLFCLVYTALPWAIPMRARRRFHAFQAVLWWQWRNPRITMEESAEAYHSGRCVYGFVPHGTLPVSMWALTYTFDRMFRDAVVFFGTQAAAIPFYMV
eukprot:gene28736-54166_t